MEIIAMYGIMLGVLNLFVLGLLGFVALKSRKIK